MAFLPPILPPPLFKLCQNCRVTTRRKVTFNHFKSPRVPNTYLTDLGRMKGSVDFGDPTGFELGIPERRIQCPNNYAIAPHYLVHCNVNSFLSCGNFCKFKFCTFHSDKIESLICLNVLQLICKMISIEAIIAMTSFFEFSITKNSMRT